MTADAGGPLLEVQSVSVRFGAARRLLPVWGLLGLLALAVTLA